MPVIPGLAMAIAADTPFFRITDISFRTAKQAGVRNVNIPFAPGHDEQTALPVVRVILTAPSSATPAASWAA